MNLREETEPRQGGGPDKTSLDYRVFVALRSRCHFQPLQLALTALSVSGNWGLFWIGLALVFWAGGALHGFFLSLFIPFAVYFTLLANYIVKSILRRERPAMDDPGLKPLVGVPSSKSFPSSHAAMSFAAASVFAYFHPGLWLLFYALAFIISWTRVYVGVHYPSDVLAGTVVGLLMGGLWALFLNWA